jgi:hypothetical protein
MVTLFLKKKTLVSCLQCIPLKVEVTIGRVGFGFRSGGSDQFDLLEEIRSIYMCFFRFLIDFNLIKVHLISGQVGFGSSRISLIFFKNQVILGSGSGRIGSDFATSN